MNMEDLKLFNITHQLLNQDLKEVETRLGIDLVESNEDYSLVEGFSQFEPRLKHDAQWMGQYYVIFYCLENTIRKLISDAMDAAHPGNWWVKGEIIPEVIFVEVEKRINKELEAGLTRRSENKMDYTTFGELEQIINANWAVFGSIFNSQRAVQKVINNLNGIRNNIAHCCVIAEDEVVRLKLSVRDWFRIQAPTSQP